MLEIREALPGDELAAMALADRVFAEWRGLYRPTPAARKRKTALAATGLRRFVGVAGGVVVGTVQCAADGGTIRLLALAVDPAWRRRGVGRALVERVAAEDPGSGISLFTVRETGNAAFFERLGFRVVEEFVDADFETPEGGPVTSLRMERPA